MLKNIVILGNGFDIQLGLKTKYSDFFQSDYWCNEPAVTKYFNTEHNNLLKYINKRFSENNNWFDLENEIKEYVFDETTKKDRQPDLNRELFQLLKRQLNNYLMKDSITFFNNYWVHVDNSANKFLSSLNRNTSIYSFNYTDIETFRTVGSGINNQSKKMLFEKKSYLHNAIKDYEQNKSKIIVGINPIKNERIPKDYYFLLKSMQFRQSTFLVNDLLKADNIVFFGFAFGENDFPYLEEFFNTQSQQDCTRKNIYIITYDENTEYKIRERIEFLTNRLDKFVDNNKLKFFHTFALEENNDETSDFEELLKILRNETC